MLFSWMCLPLGGGQDGVIPDRVVMVSYGRADALVIAQKRCRVEELLSAPRPFYFQEDPPRSMSTVAASTFRASSHCHVCPP